MTVNIQLQQENNPQKLRTGKSKIPLFAIAKISLPLSYTITSVSRLKAETGFVSVFSLGGGLQLSLT